MRRKSAIDSLASFSIVLPLYWGNRDCSSAVRKSGRRRTVRSRRSHKVRPRQTFQRNPFNMAPKHALFHRRDAWIASPSPAPYRAQRQVKWIL